MTRHASSVGPASADLPTRGAPFPLAAFPEWLGVYVADVAAALQAPLDMPAAFALGALATAGARLASINPHGTHFEPLNLFVGLVAPPGSKKSACVKAFLKPIAAWERELVIATAPDRRKANLDRERLLRELETAKNTDDWHHAEDLTETLADTPVKPEPQLTTSDVTAQKLASLLASHRFMAIFSAEPTIFPTMLGRWAKGSASSELDVFLQGHAGDAIKVDRVGRDSESVEEPRLTVAIALQPEALKSLTGADAAGRGLLARFLWILPADVRGTAKVKNAKDIPQAHQSAFENGLRAMLEREPHATPLTLSADAEEAWCTFADDFELRIGPGGDMRDLHGWGEKFRGAVARIAGLLHLAEQGTGSKVGLETLRRAIAIGGWLEGHALAAWGLMNLRADVRDANEIVEVVRRNEWERFSRQKLHQALKDRTRFKTVRALEVGLALLVKQGWLTAWAQEKREGRPSPGFDVHPSVHREGFEGFESLSGGAK